MKNIVSLDKKGWLALIQDPDTHVEIDLARVPFRMPMDDKWDTLERCLSQHLFYFVTESSCSVIVAGKRTLLPEGSLCWINPETPFRFFTNSGQFPVIWRFRLNVRRQNKSYALDEPCRIQSGAWPVFEWMKQMTWEVEKSGPWKTWRIKSLLSILSIWLFENNPAQNAGKHLLDDAMRESILQLITKNPAARLHPSDLARHLGFSADYFSRLFRKSYGVSPKSWLLKQRLHHAAALLQESKIRISELAARLGYVDVYLFSHQFRKEFGISPRAWRQSR